MGVEEQLSPEPAQQEQHPARRVLAQQSTAGAAAPLVPQSLLQQGGPGSVESLSQHLHRIKAQGAPGMRREVGGGD